MESVKEKHMKRCKNYTYVQLSDTETMEERTDGRYCKANATKATNF